MFYVVCSTGIGGLGLRMRGFLGEGRWIGGMRGWDEWDGMEWDRMDWEDGIGEWIGD